MEVKLSLLGLAATTIGCNTDVWNETVAKKALMSGSFAGLRPDLTASVFTTRKLSAQSNNILMKMQRGAPMPSPSMLYHLAVP